ncbi:hypothetical protein E4T56_gene1054 [Termitomyces sp. T112]|nr:hypothetical protein E4T56_gene1054 [Termitomyces sp. T112]
MGEHCRTRKERSIAGSLTGAVFYRFGCYEPARVGLRQKHKRNCIIHEVECSRWGPSKCDDKGAEKKICTVKMGEK